jgi:hypothetical protein
MPLVGKAEPPNCSDELTIAIWSFFERNLSILNDVSQNIYSFVMCVPFNRISVCLQSLDSS